MSSPASSRKKREEDEARAKAKHVKKAIRQMCTRGKPSKLWRLAKWRDKEEKEETITRASSSSLQTKATK